MNDEIEISAFSRLGIGTARFGREFIEALFSVCNGRIAPEYFNLWEPVNRSFEKEGLESAIRLWSEPNEVDGGFYIRRRKSPRLTMFVDWGSEECFEFEMFPWGCTAWIASLKEETCARHLLRIVIEHFSPPFGYATLLSDYRSKHKFFIDEGTSTLEKFLGMKPSPNIPGIYWKTYFGPWAIEKVGGAGKIESLPVGEVERLENGYLITAYPHVKQAGTPEARAIEERIRDHLGREHFFDRDKVDIDSLRTPPHVRKAIDEAIRKMKAEGKKSTHLEL